MRELRRGLDRGGARISVGGVLTLLAVIIAMSDRVPGHPFAAQVALPNLNWVLCLVTTPVVFWVGWPILRRSARALRQRRVDGGSLCSCAALVAWGYSVTMSLLVSGGPPNGAIMPWEAGPVFDLAAALMMVGIFLGRGEKEVGCPTREISMKSSESNATPKRM